MIEESHLSIQAEGFEDLNAALAWVVQTSDTEFKGEATNIQIQRFSRSEVGAEDDSWKNVWEAKVMGEPRNLDQYS